MNNVVCITFAGSDVHRKLQEEFHNLYEDCFYDCIPYDGESDIYYTDFYADNIKMFSHKKYFGYFLWKPYIILQTMIKYPDKLILYSDSNVRFKFGKNWLDDFIGHYLTKDHFLIRHINFTNKQYTKRDTFVLMDADYNIYWDANQCWTSFMAFNSVHASMLYSYLYYCKDERIVTEMPNTMGENLEGFVAHRWEQSVMSILATKYALSFEWDNKFIPHLIDKVYPEELKEQKKHGF